MVNYKQEFADELEEISKLIGTPQRMRDYAIQVLDGASRGPLNHSQQQVISNGISALQGIADSSIRENYGIIFNQSCVLAVSALSAITEKYFINYGDYHWDKIDVTKKGKEIKFSLSEVAASGYNQRHGIMRRIRNKDNSISFQDLGSTKRTFIDYFHRPIRLDEEDEKKIIFYQQCRHNIVHLASDVDENFVDRISLRDANIKDYSAGDKIILDEMDWNNIKTSFSKFVSGLVGTEDRWQQVLMEVKERHSILYGLLRMAEMKRTDDNISLNFRFPFHAKRVQEPANLKIILEVVHKVFGKNVNVVLTNNSR